MAKITYEIDQALNKALEFNMIDESNIKDFKGDDWSQDEVIEELTAVVDSFRHWSKPYQEKRAQVIELIDLYHLSKVKS